MLISFFALFLISCTTANVGVIQVTGAIPASSTPSPATGMPAPVVYPSGIQKPQYEYNIPAIINYDVNLENVKEYFNLREIIIYRNYSNGNTMIEKEYFLKSVKDVNVNPDYLKGVEFIKFAFNPAGACGYFNYNYILINYGNPECEWQPLQNKSKVFLHEVKHNYCYTTTGDVEFEHKGCFLSTPIDEEYGFIR